MQCNEDFLLFLADIWIIKLLMKIRRVLHIVIISTCAMNSIILQYEKNQDSCMHVRCQYNNACLFYLTKQNK